MKRMFVVLFVVAALVIGAGFYRGWFALSSPADNQSNKVNVNLTVDGEKVQEDADAVKQKTAELTDRLTGGEQNPSEQEADNVKSNDP
jgi:hypothetical protein